ncbi:MAG: hypothetical protein KGH98_00865 [Candidatus Micrarchaeota archaeon]|nr:hypothetical protein [Candidatus Micrarchaeota archaeon]
MTPSQILLAATSSALPVVSPVQTDIMPLIIAALLLDAMIVAVWYFAATLLRNQGAKQGALNEFYQLIGTVILTMIIIGALVSYASIFQAQGSLNKGSLLSQSSIMSLCSQISNTTYLQLLGKADSVLNAAAPPSTTQTPQQPFPGLCGIVGYPQSSLTAEIEYPLAATGVVVANLTNQSVANLNSYMVEDSFVGFLSRLRPAIQICVPGSNVVSCFPTVNAGQSLFYLKFDFRPYYGYDMIYSSMKVISYLMDLSFQASVAQLLIIVSSIYIWPYLIFGGLLLRAVFLTRKIGGLLIAVAIGMVIFYPTVFGIEYLALGHGSAAAFSSSPNSTASVYGFGGLLNASTNSTLAIPAANNTAVFPNRSISAYVPNFFVQPSMKAIGKYYACWPGGPAFGNKLLPQTISDGNLVEAESEDILWTMVPAPDVISFISLNVGALGFQKGAPNFPLPYNCPADGMLGMFYGFMSAYGMIGVSTYFLPIINILIVIAAILGLSGLLGGDTSLAGLSRLI